MKHLYVLVLIVFFGSILRLVSLDVTPPSLNWDEVSHGWNAYSILKTGRDEWGELPVTNFRAYGDYPLPLNLYLTIPFIAIFGLNDWSIRFPHTILGILTIIASYFLAYGLTHRRGVGLLVSLLVAVEPWFLFTSRFVVQANLSIFFLTAAGAAFFNRGRNKYLLPLSFLLLGLTLFSYHTTRIFSPLLLLVLFFIYRSEWITTFKREKVVSFLSFFVLACFFLPLPFILANPEARARSQAVFLVDEGAITKIVKNRQTSTLPLGLATLVYNRPAYFAGNFLKNYIDYFSPDFLFLKGGTQYQFSVPDKGLLYPISLPFLYIGLFILIKMALGAIPASMTTERFAVLRSTTMLPIPQILVAVGTLSLINWVRRNASVKTTFLLLTIYLVILGFFLENYLRTYFTAYPREYSWSWQYGYKEVVEYAKAHYSEYEKIIVSKKYGEPHEFFLFYWPWDPEKYRSDSNLIRFEQSNWYWVDRFDKFYFVNDWEIPHAQNEDFVLESGGNVKCQTSNVKCLLITSPGNYPLGWVLLKTVSFLDGKPAFDILEKR